VKNGRQFSAGTSAKSGGQAFLPVITVGQQCLASSFPELCGSPEFSAVGFDFSH
jgi:hypothetical protein